jgi:hypothetical protein
MEPECSLQHSQESATCPTLSHNNPGHTSSSHFLKIHFNIILPWYDVQSFKTYKTLNVLKQNTADNFFSCLRTTVHRLNFATVSMPQQPAALMPFARKSKQNRIFIFKAFGLLDDCMRTRGHT